MEDGEWSFLLGEAKPSAIVPVCESISVQAAEEYRVCDGGMPHDVFCLSVFRCRCLCRRRLHLIDNNK